MTRHSGQFAKDVAREMERRRRTRSLSVLLLLSALIFAAMQYLRCGGGWGLGGGSGTGTTTGSAVPSSSPSCIVRVSAEGIAVDGKLMKRDEAVAACKKMHRAVVSVTGDARQGDWDDLRAALHAAGIKIDRRGESP